MDVWQDTICVRFFIHLSPRLAIFVVASLTNDGCVGGWLVYWTAESHRSSCPEKACSKSQNETEKTISCWMDVGVCRSRCQQGLKPGGRCWWSNYRQTHHHHHHHHQCWVWEWFLTPYSIILKGFLISKNSEEARQYFLYIALSPTCISCLETIWVLRWSSQKAN